ncbi:type II toxin-antitoxin system VapC family toxin [Streptomyces gamaensis]|uniref:Ribonuclease VapC n=1 Tax=Streptomyces gamaensis TaxID=1763542 RepID=A0ABW0Z2V6_9ACTN
MILIADTGGLLAALNRSDKDHQAAHAALSAAALTVVSPMTVTELHQVATSRGSRAAADQAVSVIAARVASGRFSLADTTPAVLRDAVTVRQRYAGLDLDLVDAINVVLAAEYDTCAILTVDRRDFRAMRPLHGPAAFQLLPDDL